MKIQPKIRKVYKYHHKAEGSKGGAHQPPRVPQHRRPSLQVNPLFKLADHVQFVFFHPEAFGGRK